VGNLQSGRKNGSYSFTFIDKGITISATGSLSFGVQSAY